MKRLIILGANCGTYKGCTISHSSKTGYYYTYLYGNIVENSTIEDLQADIDRIIEEHSPIDEYVSGIADNTPPLYYVFQLGSPTAEDVKIWKGPKYGDIVETKVSRRESAKDQSSFFNCGRKVSKECAYDISKVLSDNLGGRWTVTKAGGR